VNRIVSQATKNEMRSLFSIKEFAELSGVKPSALRYWDELGVFSPAWRNEHTGYRYYSPEQITAVGFFKTLGSLDIPLKNMADVSDPRSLFRLCDEQISTKISELRVRRDVLRSYAALLEEGQAVQPGEIEVQTLPARPIHRIPLGGRKGAYDGLCRLRDNGSPLGYAYRGFDDLLDCPEEPAQIVVFDPHGSELRPAGGYLVGTVRNCYGGATDLARDMVEYAQDNGLEFIGPAYMIYLLDAAGTAGAEEYLLQVSVAVKSVVAGE